LFLYAGRPVPSGTGDSRDAETKRGVE